MPSWIQITENNKEFLRQVYPMQYLEYTYIKSFLLLLFTWSPNLTGHPVFNLATYSLILHLDPLPSCSDYETQLWASPV